MCGVADDDGAAGSVDSLLRFHEHVPAQERAELRLAGELLELAQHRGLVADEGALALAPYRVDQPFAMQSGADHAGGRLERRELGAADLAPFAVRHEADDADAFRAYEDRDERLGIVRGALLVAGRETLILAVGRALVAQHRAAAAQIRGQSRMLLAPTL